MKRLWTLLFTFSVTVLSILTIVLYQSKELYDFIYQYGKDTLVIEVTEVDSELSNQQIIEKLENIAEKYDVNLSQLSLYISEKSVDNFIVYSKVTNESEFKKQYQIDSDVALDLTQNQTLKLRIFNTNSKISIKDLNNLDEVGFTGIYHFGCVKGQTKEILHELSELGFNYRYYPNPSVKDIYFYISSQPYFTPLLVSLIIFLISFVLMSFYEVLIRFKEIAIYQLLGYSRKKIASLFLREKIIVSSFILGLSFLGLACYDLLVNHAAKLVAFLTFSFFIEVIFELFVLMIYFFSLFMIVFVDINQMIKGKRNISNLSHFNIVALFIFSFLTLMTGNQILENLHNHQTALDQFSYYEKIKDFSTPSVYIGSNDNSEEEVFTKILYYIQENYNDVWMMEPSSYYFVRGYNSALSQSAIDDLPILKVNSSYFNLVENNVINSQLIDSSEATLNLVVSKQGDYSSYYDDIKQKFIMSVWGTESGEIKGAPENVKINVINYAPQKFVLPLSNPTIRLTQVDSPIFIIYNNNQLTVNNITSASSMGGLYIKTGVKINSRRLSQLFEHYGLSSNIRTVSNAFVMAKLKINQLKKETQIYIFSLLGILTIYISVIVFSVYTYIENNKKQLAIKYILGYNYCQRFSWYLIINFLATLTAFIILKIASVSCSWFLLVLVVLEFMFVSVILKSRANQNIIKYLKNG